MKINSKPRQKTQLAVLVSLIAVILLGVCWFAFWQNREVPTTTSKPETTASSPKPSQPTASAPKQIQLPGAQPISPIEGEYTSDGHLWQLVNKQQTFNNLEYQPVDLELAPVASRTDKSLEERSVRRVIFEPLEGLFEAAKAAGHQLIIGSGFRSANLQNTYYSNYARVYGVEQADRFSAKPGQSEHQTGLAVDLSTTDRYCYLEACFGETAAGKWLAAHAHQYGFHLRYPQGKESITGYNYEPWHFRYLGKDLATALHESQLTFEEAQICINNPK